MARKLSEVVDGMLEVIPKREKSLRAKLSSISTKSNYTAPEAMVIEWRRVLDVLVEYIGKPEPGWQTDVASKFRGSA